MSLVGLLFVGGGLCGASAIFFLESTFTGSAQPSMASGMPLAL
jgi:hypothetical protein